jgi:hypothetical protein
MSESNKVTATAIFALVLIAAPGFALHQSPEFPGSFTGFVLGAAAAMLMVVLLVYPLAKYSVSLRGQVTKVMSMRALLTFHVYAGVVGAWLAILHTGHKFQSPLGIALVVAMLVAVVTGFVGRYYLPQTATELREDQSRLAILRSSYNRMAAEFVARRDMQTSSSSALAAGREAWQLVGAIADLEYSIGSREAVNKIFTIWIVAHVIAAILMYLLLVLHVAGAIYFGLRWLP